MSLFSDAMSLVSDIAKLVPGGSIVSSAIDLISNIADKVMPMINDLIQASPLPDEAKSIIGQAYDFGFDG